MDDARNYVKIHEAVIAFCEWSLPSVEACIRQWHQTKKGTLPACQQPLTCPIYKKPTAKSNACQSCIDWGSAVEAELYRYRARDEFAWRNVNPTILYKDVVEVAKGFVFILPHAQLCRSFDDFDVGGILKMMMGFKCYHHGDKACVDKIQKIVHIRNDLSHMKVTQQMGIPDAQTSDYFHNIKDLVTELEAKHACLKANTITSRLNKIQSSDVTVDQIQKPLTDGLQQALEKLKTIKEEVSRLELKEQHVMISYAWGDRDSQGFPCQQRMKQLKDDLEEAGFSVWSDVDSSGGNLNDIMTEAVDGAFAILVCYSKKYQESKSCKKEAQYASSLSKPIIPLRFDDHKSTGWLGLLIAHPLYYDVRTEEALKKSLPAIIEELVDKMGPTAPMEIRLRGSEAVAAYKKALKGGMKEIQSVRVMLVGQERVGKTSLLKAFMGEGFKIKEDITDGVDTSNVCTVSLSPNADLTNWKSLKGLDPKERKKQLDNKHGYEVRSEIERTLQENDKCKKEKEALASLSVSSGDSSSTSDKPQESEKLHEGPQQNSRIQEKVAQEDSESLKEVTPAEKLHVPTEVTKAKKPPDELEITFWDFGGQNLYYTTHQVFFNRRAIFALVFDMSKKLEDRCVVRDFTSPSPEEKTCHFDDFTGEDFLKFWLQSIYTYTYTEEEGEDNAVRGSSTKYPPIFIIGTHKRDKDAMKEDLAKQKIKDIIMDKPYESYVVRKKFHFVENNPADQQLSDEEAMKVLKEAFVKTAKDAPYMKEKYPIKWINFHKAVLEKVANGKHYMNYEEVKALAAEQTIEDESEITTMLNLYHDLGIIIWFGDHVQSLKDIVILDPQWLIDVFKAVITVKPYEDQNHNFVRLWRDLQEQGILREELIDHVWKEWKDIKNHLLKIMEKFDILVESVSKNEAEKEMDGAEGDVQQSLQYYVPACLQPVDKSEEENVVMDGTFYVDFDKFLPDGFFHRVLVYFARWSANRTGEPFDLCYRKCESVVGCKDKNGMHSHECSVLMIPCCSRSDRACIKVAVKRIPEFGKESERTIPDKEVCTEVYEFIAKTLQVLQDKWAKGIWYEMSVCCVACKEKLHLIPVEKCKGPQPYICQKGKRKVGIPVDMLYWNANTGSPSSSDKPAESIDQNTKGEGESKVADLETMQMVLRKSIGFLCDALDPEIALRKMKAEGAIKDEIVEEIRAKTTKPAQVEKLLDVLRKEPLSSYETFLAVLKENRNDLYKDMKKLEKGNQVTQVGQKELAKLKDCGEASSTVKSESRKSAQADNVEVPKLIRSDRDTLTTGDKSQTTDPGMSPKCELRKSDKADNVLPEVSTLIGSEGGTLSIGDNLAQLDIPPKALEKQTQISMRIVSAELDHPPLQDNFIVAPIVRLEPDGQEFLRPVTLSVKHAAVNLVLRNLAVWMKTQKMHGEEWHIFFDGQRDIKPAIHVLLTENSVKIRCSHFCYICWTGLCNLRVRILPFLPLDIRMDLIRLIVYAIKEFDEKTVKAVEENMNKNGRYICLECASETYDMSKHEDLQVDICKVTDLNGIGAWKAEEMHKEIEEKDINIGSRSYNWFELKAIKKPYNGISGVLEVSQASNRKVKMPICSSSAGNIGHGAASNLDAQIDIKVSDEDILHVARSVGLTGDDLEVLYTGLGMEEATIDRCKQNAKTSDFTLQAIHVLREWRRQLSKEATRRKILDTLQVWHLNDAAQQLVEKWKSSS